ncbi:MAG: Asp-tRNA(Asn)/Glu-tRNA(Gln) amidotransferase subunit GatB [Candidatus Nealsonbacteria bacterium]|nr:Asp-tRNA(Asn)/Glu-tRNA(Gln) amidotransferase subunit GatB [Candidatus Nealsonbacteria bacterium]
MEYRPTIGLEIHIELNTKSKMFCDCKNDAEERRPNINICPICAGHPGTLPVINQAAVRKVIETGLALNCRVPEHSKFDRKNYFYPDLPKGYQISQYDQPLCQEGFLEIEGRKIRVRRVHLEEDTGRLAHPEGADHSLVDFNRAGVPLMELVTEPDLTSAKEARAFAETLHLILHYLGVSDADMEKGEMRVEVNISLSAKKGELGTKVEIKNLNSFRSVERGIDYEIKRQAEVLGKGEKIVQETRGWDDAKGITVSQREKEEAHDYRYFPEPDLPPLHFTKKEVEEIKAEIPELPRAKQARFVKQYGLGQESADILVYNKSLGEYFEGVAKKLPKDSVKQLADFLINTEAKSCKIPSDNLSQLLVLIKGGKLSVTAAKTILPEIIEKDPAKVIEEKGMGQMSDKGEIETAAREVVLQNVKAVEDYRSGKEAALQFLVGQLMAKTKGRANPDLARSLLTKILKGV